jgi:hypothetical protein
MSTLDTSPAQGVVVVTPSDTNPLRNPTRAIRANTAGVIKCTFVDGTTALCNFAAGETRPISAVIIWSTGTTVSGVIEGMY